MAIPLMLGSLVFVPKVISYIALIILVLAGIAEFRQGHIGRLGIAGNAFLLWQIFFPIFSTLPNWFQWYLNIGTILAIIAVPSYLFKFSLPSEFYTFSFIGYGSFSIILAIVVPLII